jgi:CubicO group peptidase (beta-lactamase class C family)
MRKTLIHLLITACVFFPSCRQVQESSGSPTLSESRPYVTIPPNEAGLSSERLHDIDAMVNRYIDQKELAGAVVLLARQGKVAYLKPFGFMDITTKKRMSDNAIFRMMSMTKPAVSVAAMILYEEGKLQLEDHVSKFVPELKDLKVFRDRDRSSWTRPHREVTIHDLLRHTSGLTYGGPTPAHKMYEAANLSDINIDLHEMIRKLSELPLLFSPGERWEYGRSTDVLGYVIQVISGKPIDVFLRERVFQPLRMTDTDFFVPLEKQDRFTSLHARSDQGALTVTDAPSTGKWSRKPKLLEPGAGLVSTASDYFRFSQMLLNRGELDGVRILSPKTIDLMTANHVPSQALPLTMSNKDHEWMIKGWGFGLGFRVLLDPVASGLAASAGSYGWFGYYDTFFLVDPEKKLIGIFLAQFTPPPVYPGVQEFQNLMFQAVVR